MVSQLGCSVAWVNGIPVCWLCFMLVRLLPCTYISCSMSGNTSIPCGSSLNNIPIPGDGLVVFQFSPNMGPQFGYIEAWMNRILVYWLYPRLVRPCICTHNTYGMDSNTSTAFVHSVTTYTNLTMAWLSCSAHQIWLHILATMWLEWMVSLCVDYVSCLIYLEHTPTKYVQWVVTLPYPVVLHLETYPFLGMVWWFCSPHEIWYHSLGTLKLGWTGS